MAKKKIEVVDDRNNKSTKVEIRLNDIEALSAIGLTGKEIAYVLGICPQTFSEYKNNYPEINEAIEEGRAVDKQSLIEKMRILTDRGNNRYNAIKYLLSSLHGMSETNKIDVTTQGESINKIEVVVKGSKSNLLDKE